MGYFNSISIVYEENLNKTRNDTEKLQDYLDNEGDVSIHYIPSYYID